MRLALAFSAALLLTGCDLEDFGPSDRYQSDFHYSYDLKPSGRLSLDNFNGSVEIQGWDESKVDITGVKYASSEDIRDAIKIEIHNTPDSIDVRTVRPSMRHGNMGARYTIRVPRKIELNRIVSSNGHVRIHDVDGPAHARTSNGSIRVDTLNGDVDVQTSNGPIEVEAVKGSATMKTSNGRIRAENVTGQCEADTSNGSITIRLADASASPMRLATSNGAIDLTMQSSPRSDIHAETSNGGITLRLPANTNARVHADTSHSGVTSDFDVSTRLRGSDQKNHLDGTIGSGGPTIDLSTTNGHIRLLKS